MGMLVDVIETNTEHSRVRPESNVNRGDAFLRDFKEYENLRNIVGSSSDNDFISEEVQKK